MQVADAIRKVTAAIRKVTAAMQTELEAGRRSANLDAHDLIEVLLAVAGVGSCGRSCCRSLLSGEKKTEPTS